MNDPATAEGGAALGATWWRDVVMGRFYVRRRSARYRGIPLHGGRPGPSPDERWRLTSDGGGAVSRRMLGYGLLAAGIEHKADSRMRDAGRVSHSGLPSPADL